jgi:hypothetical protein
MESQPPEKAKTQADLLASQRPYVAARDLGYFREARFFLGKNRATLTFFSGSEVASIHYDMVRDEIFLKGHNVKNMTLTEEQWTSLHRFADYLSESPKTKAILQAYRNCLDQLMLRRMQNAAK